MLLRGTGRGTGPEILDPGAVVYDTRYRATSNIINGFVLSYTRFSHDIIQRAIALASAVRGDARLQMRMRMSNAAWMEFTATNFYHKQTSGDSYNY